MFPFHVRPLNFPRSAFMFLYTVSSRHLLFPFCIPLPLSLFKGCAVFLFHLSTPIPGDTGSTSPRPFGSFCVVLLSIPALRSFSFFFDPQDSRASPPPLPSPKPIATAPSLVFTLHCPTRRLYARIPLFPHPPHQGPEHLFVVSLPLPPPPLFPFLKLYRASPHIRSS